MQTSEITTGVKLTFPKYKFEKYPLEMFSAEGVPQKVHSDEEYEALSAMGYTENPPAITHVVPPANMTTAPAIQASYDALKKQYEGTVLEFNVKYATLKSKYDALLKEHEEFLIASMK